MEKYIHSLDLRDDALQADGIRAIGITAWRIRWACQPMVGYDGSIRTNIILAILDAVQLEYRYLIEVHHIADDVMGSRLFLEEESTSRDAMTQWDGADAYRTVIVDYFRFARIDGMELYIVCHSLAEEFQLWSQELFQFFVCVDMERSGTSQQSEGGNQPHQSETMVTMQVGNEDMVEV
jgi:hypothetical protein